MRLCVITCWWGKDRPHVFKHSLLFKILQCNSSGYSQSLLLKKHKPCFDTHVQCAAGMLFNPPLRKRNFFGLDTECHNFAGKRVSRYSKAKEVRNLCQKVLSRFKCVTQSFEWICMFTNVVWQGHQID